MTRHLLRPINTGRRPGRCLLLLLTMLLGVMNVTESRAATPTFTKAKICSDITNSPDISVADFNGDGKLDVLVGGMDYIALCVNGGGGSFSSSVLVPSPGGKNTKVVAADVNGDGRMDLVGIDAGSDEVVWWQNNGDGTFTRSIVGSSVGGPSDIFVTDLDGDGDRDIVTSSYQSDQVIWWRNDGANQSVPKRLYISDRTSNNYKIVAVDPQTNSQLASIALSNSHEPGDLAASPDGKKLYAVAGTDVLIIDVLTNTVTATVSNAGGDGSSTHLAVSPDGSKVYVASHRTSSSLQIKVIDTTTNAVVNTITQWAFNSCNSVTGFGIQPSGGSLYLACSASTGGGGGWGGWGGWGGSEGEFFMIDIASYNVSKTATFSNPSLNTTYVNAMAVNPDGSEVYLARANISFWGSSAAVEVFNGSNGTFKQSISLSGGFFTMLRAATVTPDGSKLYVTDSSNGIYDIDLATKTVTATLPKSTSSGNDIVMSSDGSAIYTSMSGDVYDNATSNDSSQATITGTFSNAYNLAYTPGNSGGEKFTKVIIGSGFNGAASVRAADLNNDGRLDILAAAHQGKAIAWWRQNSSGTFSKFIIDNRFRTAAVVRAADIDGDGWQDVIAAGDGSGGTSPGLVWWRNNHNNTFTKHVVDSYSSSDLEIADLDNDGHPDIAAMTYGTTQVLWWQNNGSGTFSRAIADTSGGESAIEVGDLDKDGYQDIVESGTGKNIYWWHNGGADVGIPFGFNAVEPQSGSAPAADKDPLAGKLHTKVDGQAFDIDIVALADTNKDGVADGVDTNYAMGGDRTVELQVVSGTCASYTVLETLTSVVFHQADQATEQGRKEVALTIHYTGQNLHLVMTDDNGTPDPSDDVVGCSTDVFTVRPARYTLEVWQNDEQSAGSAVQLNNGTSSGLPVHKAGRPVRVIVKALDASGNNVMGFTGHTVSLVETKGDGTMRNGNYFYTDGVTPAQVTFDGTDPGEAVNDTATYKEVGWLYLAIANDDTYAKAGGDGGSNDASTAAEMQIQGSGQVTVGRFIPDHFQVTVPNAGSFKPGCGTFTYMGEGFGIQAQPQLMITAQNSNGDTVQNYQGNYWKLNDITESYQNLPSTPLGANVTFFSDPAQDLHSPATDAAHGSNGSVTVDFTQAYVRYDRNAIPVAPFTPNIDMTFPLTDSDGVTCLSCSSGVFSLSNIDSSGIQGPGELRYGRLAFTPDPHDNYASGPETSAITKGVEAEYFSGTKWIVNTADTCTAITSANYDLKSDVQDPGLGNNTVNVGSSGHTTLSIAASPLAGAATDLNFSAPGTLNTGAVDFTVDLAAPANAMPWLQYDWDGNGTLDNLQGQVRFGPYDNKRWIYMREPW